MLLTKGFLILEALVACLILNIAILISAQVHASISHATAIISKEIQIIQNNYQLLESNKILISKSAVIDDIEYTVQSQKPIVIDGITMQPIVIEHLYVVNKEVKKYRVVTMQ